MSSIAYVNNGEIVKTASQESIASQVSGSGAGDMNKDTFLQLLVAQMKYQDPLEPTSNTEYISQYATFTQVEEIQNMASTMELSRASSLVGQEVIVTTKGSDGVTSTIQGKVDFVTYEAGKAYVSIGGELYSVSDVSSVVDTTYMKAYDLATNMVSRLLELPNVNGVSEKDLSEIAAIKEIYDNMDEYQKSFVEGDIVKSLNAYVEKAEEVKKNLEAYEAKQAEEAEAAEETETTEPTDDSTTV